MASYTENLNLLKKDPVADASDTFNIQTMLNDNWDKIDAAMAAAKAAEEYDAAGTYVVGDYCVHDGKLYKCVTSITAGEAWNAAHWMATSIGAELEAMLAHIGNKNNPHGVTPAQIGAVTTTDLAAALEHTHRVGEIMLVAAPVTELPDNVLPCTGGYYDKTAFPKLFDAIGFRCGIKLEEVASTVTNQYLSTVSTSYFNQPFDPVRHEFYCFTSGATTVSVVDKTLTLVRTLTLSKPIVCLKAYDGIVAICCSDITVSPTEYYFCVSVDGGVTFDTYTSTTIFPLLGMSKTKIYLGYENTVSSPLLVYDKLSHTYTISSIQKPSSMDKLTFTNDDYVVSAYSSSNGTYTTTKICNIPDTPLITDLILSRTTTFSHDFTNSFIYKGICVGFNILSDTTQYQLCYYDPKDCSYGTLDFIMKCDTNNNSYYFWSLCSAGLIILPSNLSAGFSGMLVNVTVNQIFAIHIANSNGVNARGLFNVLTDAGYIRVDASSVTANNVKTGPFPTQFRVPEAISTTGQYLGYIYTGED